MFRKGETVGITKLRNTYDDWFHIVLVDSLQCLETRKGEKTRFKVLKNLPSPQDYQKLAVERFTLTVESLIKNAYRIIEESGNKITDRLDLKKLKAVFRPQLNGKRGDEVADMLRTAAGAMLDFADGLNELADHLENQGLTQNASRTRKEANARLRETTD